MGCSVLANTSGHHLRGLGSIAITFFLIGLLQANGCQQKSPLAMLCSLLLHQLALVRVAVCISPPLHKF